MLTGKQVRSWLRLNFLFISLTLMMKTLPDLVFVMS